MLEEELQLPALGVLEVARRCRDFDVELTFTNASLIVETKVDSDEDGRYSQEWQTERIHRLTQAAPWLKPTKYYLFITYGYAEFFGKRFDPGPASSIFQHVPLDRMVHLLRRVCELPIAGAQNRHEWLEHMEREQRVRASAPTLLVQFSRFRSKYLELRDDVDFDRNRVLFCAPEIAFPVFRQVADLWNAGQAVRNDLGRVSVYPVARRNPTVVDSILNFYELWEAGRPSFSGRLPSIGASAYFEMNEDLNLNLKLDVEGTQVPDDVINEVQTALDQNPLPEAVRGRRRNYRQTNRVIYEWDLQCAGCATDIPQLAERIAGVLSQAVQKVA